MQMPISLETNNKIGEVKQIVVNFKGFKSFHSNYCCLVSW